MKEILFRDYLDISFSNAPVRARRVLSPTNEALNLLQQQEHHQLQRTHRNPKYAREYEAASHMIGCEMNLLDVDYPERGDEGVTIKWCTLTRQPPDRRQETILQLAHITWFRWKVQESFLCVAEELIRVGLISLDAIYTPMNLSQQTLSTSAVMKALNCFAIPRSCMDHQELIFGTHFLAPPLWLATLIVRSCTDWTRIVNRLTTVPLLGELDSELVLKVVQERPNFTVNPDEGKITGEISKTSSYALWLPHGTRLEDFLSTWTDRYSQAMEAYYIATGKHWEGFEDVEKRMVNLLTMEMELYN
ncbi:hypothetical protein V1517DRAFT_95073 [Lipomyces orientalis]|uniref:Uncharacterized protein n=1 Tax=Lipomyces orientalis TaxID=1233043 RepID=A0ACC3TCR5_9ASCO